MEGIDKTSKAAEADEDAILMLEVAKGDEHALRMLIEKWKNPLANYFYRSVSDVHTSEDLTQQTFINLYRAREKYEVSAKFSTYLFHIARHVLINEYRRSVRRPAEVSDPSEMECPVDGRGDLALGELEEIFHQTLKSLPEKQRTAILLLKQQELSYENIATIMDSSVSAVKTWIHRARNALKDALRNSHAAIE